MRFELITYTLKLYCSTNWAKKSISTKNGTRTRTTFWSTDFKSVMSTYSIILASNLFNRNFYITITYIITESNFKHIMYSKINNLYNIIIIDIYFLFYSIIWYIYLYSHINYLIYFWLIWEHLISYLNKILPKHIKCSISYERQQIWHFYTYYAGKEQST